MTTYILGAFRAALRKLAAALAMALWAGSAPPNVWLLFVPIGLTKIGDGMSGPAVIAAALSLHPRLAGTRRG